jgi:hypothetical protein
MSMTASNVPGGFKSVIPLVAAMVYSSCRRTLGKQSDEEDICSGMLDLDKLKGCFWC